MTSQQCGPWRSCCVFRLWARPPQNLTVPVQKQLSPAVMLTAPLGTNILIDLIPQGPGKPHVAEFHWVMTSASPPSGG